MRLRRGVDARIEGFYVEGLHRLSRRGEGVDRKREFSSLDEVS
jgi:hypothetical protein